MDLVLNLCCRWGGERNRPLESAKRIADAALADFKEDEEGPVTKKRRIQETYSDEEEGVGANQEAVEDGTAGDEKKKTHDIADPLFSCVGQAPIASIPQGSDVPANDANLQSSRALEGEMLEDTGYQSPESTDESEKEENGVEEEEEKSFFDAEAIHELNLTEGKVATVRAKIINGLSIAGKAVQVK